MEARQYRVRRRIFAIFLIIIGIVLIVAGSNWRKIGNAVVRHESTNIVNKQKWHIHKPSQKQSKRLAYGNEKDKLSSPYQIWTYAHANHYPLYLAGYIAIPSRDILLPINHGNSNRVLAVGAGTLKDSNAPAPYNEADVMGKSNYALCGHNMDDNYTLFSPITHMSDGENIYVTNGKQIFVYRKISTHVIPPTDIQVIFNTKETNQHPVITLTTCNWTGSMRYEIRGKLIKKISWRQASQYQRSLFPRRSE